MRQIRFESLAQRKSNRYSKRALISFGLCVCLLGLSRLFGGNFGLFCLIVGLPVAYFGAVSLKESRSWDKGDDGEWLAVKALKDLPEDYTVVRNWVIPGSKVGDIDVLVLGPHGALVVEVKNYADNYICEGSQWFNVKPNGFRKRTKSPCTQLDKASRALSQWLKREGIQMPVQKVLVLPTKSRIQLHQPTVPVVTRDQLADHILALPKAKESGTKLLQEIDRKAA